MQVQVQNKEEMIITFSNEKSFILTIGEYRALKEWFEVAHEATGYPTKGTPNHLVRDCCGKSDPNVPEAKRRSPTDQKKFDLAMKLERLESRSGDLR